MAYLGNAPVVGDSTNSFKLLDDIASFTLTFDATDTSVVSISGDTLSFTNHRFVTGQKVTYTDGGGTAIGGLSDGTSYFIIKVDQNTIKLATNASNAASSTAINLTSGAAGGSHTLKVAFDGVNTKFKATHGNGTKASISRAGQLSLSINGVIQQPQDSSSPSVGYGVEADSTIVFSTAPVATDKVFATFIGEVAPSFDITDNTIDNFTGDGSTTIFNLSKEVPSSQDVLVTLDGVTQHPSDGSTTRSYSVIDQALTFVSAPATGVAIQARHIGFAGATTSAVTGFYGRTGNAALINTDDISVQNISAGIATFNTIAVGGTVSIGGTLTYEDVTNIDSVGLVTARNGIVVGSGITLSKDGDVFFTGIATGNGSGLTALNASNISSGTVPTARLGSGTASSSTFLRGDSTFATVTSTTINNNADNRLITGSGTANTLEAESTLTYDGTNLDLGDAKKIRLGASQDLQIYHDTESYIKSATASVNLILESAHDVYIKHGGENMIKCTGDGGVQLYYDNSSKLETISTGIRMQNSSEFTVNGGTIQFGHSSSSDDRLKFGANDTDLQIFHGGNGQFDVNTGDVIIRNTGDFSSSREIFLMARVDEQSVTCYSNGAVELYYDNAKKFQTITNGVHADNRILVGESMASRGFFSGDSSSVSIGSLSTLPFYLRTNSVSRWTIGGSDGHLMPYANNTYDIGTSSYRVRNIYTMDLHCSNKGSSNDVDGTWGDYTIQEGESDLFLINNRSGKKYKFNLTEVS